MSNLIRRVHDLDRRLREVEAKVAHGHTRPLGSDGEMLARLGTDAQKWAEEFIFLYGGYIVSRADIAAETIGPDVLAGWFANAIGAGEMKNAVALDYLRFLTGPDWRERAQRWFEQTYASKEGDDQ